MGGHVADGDAGAALGGTVGLRAVDQVDVVERHLPGLEHHVPGRRLVEGVRYMPAHFLPSDRCGDEAAQAVRVVRFG